MSHAGWSTEIVEMALYFYSRYYLAPVWIFFYIKNIYIFHRGGSAKYKPKSMRDGCLENVGRISRLSGFAVISAVVAH